MEAALSLVTAGWMRAFSLEGILDYPAPLARKELALVGAHYRESFEAAAKAANFAPDAETTTVAWCTFSVWAIYCNRQHTLPEYNFDDVCGEGGARLRENIERWGMPRTAYTRAAARPRP